MYLRTIGEALDAMAEVLRLDDRRDQLVHSTVQIMLCLDLEPRSFLVDCQTYLVHDGMATLRSRRRAIMNSVVDPLLAGPAPEAEKALEAVASAMDALHYADLVRRILPGLREERWRIARAILVNEAGLRHYLHQAILGRAQPSSLDEAEEAVREMVLSLHQPWMDRAGAIRTTCLDGLKSLAMLETEDLHPEAELLFELFATSDERATGLLSAVDRDPLDAFLQVSRLEDVATALRAVGADSPRDPTGGAGVRDVA